MEVARPPAVRLRRISPAVAAVFVLAALLAAGAALAYNEIARVDPLRVSVNRSHPALAGDFPAALGATVENTGRFPLTVTGASVESGAAVHVGVRPEDESPSVTSTVPLGVLSLEPGEHATLYVLAPANGCTPKERRAATRVETIDDMTLTYARLGTARTARVDLGSGTLGIARGHNIECSVARLAP
jgi:hypothetical protein